MVLRKGDLINHINVHSYFLYKKCRMSMHLSLLVAGPLDLAFLDILKVAYEKFAYEVTLVEYA